MLNKKWRIRVSVLAVTVLVGVLIAGCGGGTGETTAPDGGQQGGEATGTTTIRLTIGSGHPAESMPYTRAGRDFFVPEVEKRVAEQTNYRIEWTEAYAGSIAKLGEVLEATESGLLDVGLVPYPFEPSKLYLQNLAYYVPFNSPDAAQVLRVARKVFEEYPVLKDMFEEKYNQKFLAMGAVGNYDLITTFPWETVEDLKGHKIAAAGPNLPFLQGTGAIPVQSDLNEAYTSFQTGVYEGWIMYPASTYGFKLHEVAPYHKNVGFGAVAVNAITVNLDRWNQLPAEVQGIIEEVASEYEQNAAPETAMQMDADALTKMEQEGAHISDLSLEEKAKWANMLPNLPNEKAKEADSQGLPGSEVMRAYLQYLQEDGYQLPRQWEIE